MAHDNDHGWWEIEEKLQLARIAGYKVGTNGLPSDWTRDEH